MGVTPVFPKIKFEVDLGTENCRPEQIKIWGKVLEAFDPTASHGYCAVGTWLEKWQNEGGAYVLTAPESQEGSLVVAKLATNRHKYTALFQVAPRDDAHTLGFRGPVKLATKNLTLKAHLQDEDPGTRLLAEAGLALADKLFEKQLESDQVFSLLYYAHLRGWLPKLDSPEYPLYALPTAIPDPLPFILAETLELMGAEEQNRAYPLPPRFQWYGQMNGVWFLLDREERTLLLPHVLLLAGEPLPEATCRELRTQAELLVGAGRALLLGLPSQETS